MKRYALTILFAALASVCVLKMTEQAAAQGKKAAAPAAPPMIDKEKIRGTSNTCRATNWRGAERGNAAATLLRTTLQNNLLPTA